MKLIITIFALCLILAVSAKKDTTVTDNSKDSNSKAIAQMILDRDAHNFKKAPKMTAKQEKALKDDAVIRFNQAMSNLNSKSWKESIAAQEAVHQKIQDKIEKAEKEAQKNGKTQVKKTEEKKDNKQAPVTTPRFSASSKLTDLQKAKAKQDAKIAKKRADIKKFQLLASKQKAMSNMRFAEQSFMTNSDIARNQATQMKKNMDALKIWRNNLTKAEKQRKQQLRFKAMYPIGKQ